MSKMKSRKLWVAIGSVVSILLADLFGIQMSPEAIAGVAFLAGTYILGQGLVDKDVVTAQVKVAGDVGKVQLELYARNLERQLEEVMSISPGAVSLSGVPDIIE